MKNRKTLHHDKDEYIVYENGNRYSKQWMHDVENGNAWYDPHWQEQYKTEWNKLIYRWTGKEPWYNWKKWFLMSIILPGKGQIVWGGILIVLLGMLFVSDKIYAHPDGITPYWYPSEFVYGFVSGCSTSIEQNQPPFTQEMWPDEVEAVCGCVMDSLRHSLTWEEFDQMEDKARIEQLALATLPICIDEVKRRKGSK